MMARPPLVVILNGMSSVGKSSIAKELQKISARHLLHVEGDMFLKMLPPKLWGTTEGIVIESTIEHGLKALSFSFGPAVDQLMEGMRAAVGALALQGNDLIVDGLMLSAADQKSYYRHGVDCNLRFVGLHAPLAVLEERERERGDRLEGLVRWQSSRVHDGIDYDFALDTSGMTIGACAHQVAVELDLL